MVGAHLVAACLLVLAPAPPASAASRAQEPEAAVSPTIDTTNDAGEDDDPEPRRKLVKWNEYEGPIATFRFGFGLLVDAAAYDQDAESRQQVTIEDPDGGVRDSRLLFRGRFQTERPFSWTFGYMYDNADGSWRVRQTGFQIGFPEAKGSLFIGRTKEGFSMNKVMNGYSGWTQERTPIIDVVPILADGLKWSGYFPERRVFFSLGAFGDELSEDEGFSTYDHQVAARVGWLPIASEEEKKLLHVAVMGRTGHPDEGSLRLRSKPENSLAPFFADTGKIASDRAQTTGGEIYYRKGPWLIGGEYDWHRVDTTGGREEAFHGGNVVATWIITGETRAYNAPGGYFNAVSPDRTVFEGGPGAWEAVLNFSYIDLDSENFRGGTFWRVTPMLNWHLSDNARWEIGYGYGRLDRFDLRGDTQFFQTRLQLQL
jgi:phosphate-selective porin OprO/OprP